MATSSSNSTSSVSSDNALKNADASDTPHNILIAQQQFIELTKAEATKNAKNSIPTPVLIQPPQPYYGSGLPVVADFYLKPIIICAPHLNFPSHSILCGICKSFPMKSVGWGPNDRYIHGLSSGVYLCQYRYKCSNKHC